MNETTIRLEAAGTDANTNDYALIPEGKWEIVGARRMDVAGITADNTDYQTFSLKANTDEIDSRATTVAGGGFTAVTDEEIEGILGLQLDSDGGLYLHLDSNKSGTGPAHDMRYTLVLRQVL